MTLKFYTNPMSRGQIARWALHEAGADYEQILLEYGTSMKADDYLKINPMGKVPAIDRDRRRSYLRLSGRSFPRCRPRTDGSGTGRLLPVAILCGGAHRSGDHQQDTRL